MHVNYNLGMVNNLRKCCVCKVNLPEENFYKPKCLNGRPASRCIQCSRAYAIRYRLEHLERRKAYDKEYMKRKPAILRRKHGLKERYGISLEAYESILSSQGGICAICKCPPPDGKVLHVDHDHETDIVRGLLCQRCNLAVGHFQDDINRLLSAIDYLRSAGTQR